MKAESMGLLYVNGQLELNATEYNTVYDYTMCAPDGVYLFAVSVQVADGTNAGSTGLIASIQHGNKEISYTGDRKWVGVESEPSVN